MLLNSGMIVVSLSLLSAGPAGKWLGQDGHDVVGPSSEVKPSDVQDMHILLGNLPPRNIVSVRVLGEGGDEWAYPSRGPWAAGLQRKAKAATADLFLEPSRVEKGRSFQIIIEFEGGAKTDVWVKGRKADPNLRTLGAALSAKWVGQERQDWAGPDLGVGPDGLQDARIALMKLSAKVKVESAELEGPGGLRWHAGRNPKAFPNAELIRDEKDPAHADFYFQPESDLTGKSLKLTVTYENGKTDSATLAGGRVDPKLKMPRLPLPDLKAIDLKAEWLGQDGSQEAGPGTVHVALSGLPSRALAAIVLSDAVRGSWRYRENDRVPVDSELETQPLVVQRAGSGGRVDLFFAPYRDETGATMTVRLVFQDGSMAFAQFPGGRSDIALRAPVPAATSVNATPGDDLQDLVNRFGTVRLAKGTYALGRPLVLSQPVKLIGDPGAVLLFSQAANEPAWTTAVKFHRGGTTLQGFAIRFAGPVRWNTQVNWGPAILGVTDNLDGVAGKQNEYMVIHGLDIEAPPAADPKGWEHSPHLMRLVGTSGGVIAQNTLRGGDIEFFSGPWRIESNDYRGTPPGTYSDSVFSAHNPNDLLIRGNRAQPVGASGKTWRFLVLTGQGAHDRIENNTINGIGARDDDTIPWSNAPEIMLTESYTLLFEGKPAAISTDGRVLRIAKSHNRPPRTGDAVAVLTGASAGQWRRIAQAINGTTFLLDRPLPPNAELVSIATGFLNETFEKNSVDAPGASRSTALVLTGNCFGTRIRDNRFAGAGGACDVIACASESPLFWGWSHVPFFDAEVVGNTFEDSERGASFNVQHGKPVKTNRGRAYMTLTLENNTVRWTEAFLKHRSAGGAKALPPGITLGSADSLDPGELRVSARDNRLGAPPATPASGPLAVPSATFNGQSLVGKSFALPREEGPAKVGRRER
ncbi:MAG: hypothetical protein P4L84_14905 [Isosphaeraceae bacterium]|nr:hypothetical protein [Isosphaeraceae bacterium]